MKIKYPFHSVRVYLTERCNANCPSCFNRMNRTKSQMAIEKFKLICKYFNSLDIKHIKIMGGEPTIHEQFSQMIAIAQFYFESVHVFTNGTNPAPLSNIAFRKTDSIIYNFLFASKYTEEIIQPEKTFNRALEIIINSSTKTDQLISNYIKLEEKYGNIFRPCLTLDCASNIFKEKNIILPKLKEVEKYFIDHKIPFKYDHKVPYCFAYKTGLHFGNNGLCKIEDTVLIDADYNLRFCNQISDKIINIFEGEKIIPWNILENYLAEVFYTNQLNALNKICKSCVFYNKYCNGGCFINSEIISKQDIIMNTNLPLM